MNTEFFVKLGVALPTSSISRTSSSTGWQFGTNSVVPNCIHLVFTGAGGCCEFGRQINHLISGWSPVRRGGQPVTGGGNGGDRQFPVDIWIHRWQPVRVVSHLGARQPRLNLIFRGCLASGVHCLPR